MQPEKTENWQFAELDYLEDPEPEFYNDIMTFTSEEETEEK